MFHQSAQEEMGSTFEKNAGENRGWEANFAKKATFVCIVDTALTSKFCYAGITLYSFQLCWKLVRISMNVGALQLALEDSDSCNATFLHHGY
jgi:hypothetical protein